MKIVFVDETENAKRLPRFYAVSAVVVDSVNYTSVRADIEKALADAGWCPEHEFKGIVLFSSTQGDTSVSIEKRIDAAAGIVGSTMSDKNARCACAFAWNLEGSGTANHLRLVEDAIKCALPRSTSKMRDKNVCVVFADQKDSIPRTELSAVAKRALRVRGYMMLEDVVVVESSCAQPGVLLADIAAYLGMWTYAGHVEGNPQSALFDEAGGSVPARVGEKLDAVQRVLEGGSGLRFMPKLPRR